jgi:hypothetical protein
MGRRSEIALAFVGWHARGDQVDPIEGKVPSQLTGDRDMSAMNGIEGASEKSDARHGLFLLP